MCPVLDPIWRDSPTLPPLAAGEIHVWRAALDVEPTALLNLARTLSADENDRARRFIHATDRDRYVAARAILRDILARYTASEASAIRFDYGPRGKPRMADNPSGIQFSLAHSESLALYAVTVGDEVGVDVERVQPLPELQSMARTILDASQWVEFAALAPDCQANRFYRNWTCKEAAVKALGLGLALDPRELLADLDAQPFARVTHRRDTTFREWTVIELQPAPGYAGAIALPAPPESLHFHQWHG